jgi:hypothetical protein
MTVNHPDMVNSTIRSLLQHLILRKSKRSAMKRTRITTALQLACIVDLLHPKAAVMTTWLSLGHAPTETVRCAVTVFGRTLIRTAIYLVLLRHAHRHLSLICATRPISQPTWLIYFGDSGQSSSQCCTRSISQMMGYRRTVNACPRHPFAAVRWSRCPSSLSPLLYSQRPYKRAQAYMKLSNIP